MYLKSVKSTLPSFYALSDPDGIRVYLPGNPAYYRERSPVRMAAMNSATISPVVITYQDIDKLSIRIVQADSATSVCSIINTDFPKKRGCS
jgi:hypothetical protein